MNRPPSPSLRSHVVVLPGGGYRMHSDHEGEPVAEWLRGLGLDASVFLYPLHTLHPGPLSAVRSEIARLRATGVERVAVLGFSAGGHAAGLAALAPDDAVPEVGRAGAADLVLLCYPVVSMLTPSHSASRDILLGLSPSESLRRATSLELLVTPSSPPAFVWHTADDDVVDVRPVYDLARALSTTGIPHAVHVYPSGAHGLGLATGSGAPEHWTTEAATWLRDVGWVR
ncbi:alpha/beta hydrolase [Herbiconiux sp. P15]|uniref:alpha/beta hydrolase n=1 Tax=Herbiconiux liukaitaii TaxID=3342799 RepID=UPI0035B9897B